MLIWLIRIGIAIAILILLFLLRKKIFAIITKLLNFLWRHKIIVGVVFGLAVVGFVIGWLLVIRPISAPSVLESKVFSVSPSTLTHNYPETLLVFSWRGETKEGDQIEISIGPQKLAGISVKSQKDEGNIIISSAAGFLEVPPESAEIEKRLKPGRYDAVIKHNGRVIAHLEKAVQVLPNPYAIPVPNKAKVAIAFLFVIGIIGVALYFIFQSKKKKPASTTPTPATPPTVTP